MEEGSNVQGSACLTHGTALALIKQGTVLLLLSSPECLPQEKYGAGGISLSWGWIIAVKEEELPMHHTGQTEASATINSHVPPALGNVPTLLS